MKRTNKRIVGLGFWLITLVSTGVAASRWMQTAEQGDRSQQTLASIARYVARQETQIVAIDPIARLQPGDPVFLAGEPMAGKQVEFRQVGRVASIIVPDSVAPDSERPGDLAAEPPRGGRRVSITWYDRDVPADQCQLFQHHSTGRLSEVVETLFPPTKQKVIRDQLSAAMARHGEDLSQAFIPLVEDSLRQSLPVIEDEFRLAVARHRGELDEAAQRWHDQLVQERLIPMARREILPIVKKHGQPPAEEIGREMWDRASLFRFGWRAIYDKTPLPRKDLVREEWQRFVEEEAVPVLEKHMDEVVVAIQRSLRDVSASPAIRKELAGVAEEIARDPQSRQLVQSILKETFVENERLREVWRDVWSSPKAQAAFDIAGERLEPVVRQIGDEIFGSEQDGINPDFARVLRSQILRKDRRWIVAWHTGAGNGTIEVARNPMPYPIVYLAAER
ncbi:hypothetical protein [Stieleria neptunia]|uniref:hypothetical protein n=1 Tax=Stieleria neptunia TaxID=2527979 RepID=UPI00119D5BD2|nr:hypothetical protein [Stieleria neptunia]